MKQALLISIGIVIVGGIAIFFIWHALTPSPQQTLQSGFTTSSSGGIYTSEVSVNASQSSVAATTTPTIETEYQSILTQFSATEISFNVATSGDIYALYASNVATSKESFPKASQYSIDVAMVDLNSDGVDEALVLNDLPGFCGTAGCPFDIYQKQNSKWVDVFSMLVEDAPALANTYIAGYQNLLLPVEIESQSEIMNYTWNGQTYKASQVMATWDGSNFQVAQ